MCSILIRVVLGQDRFCLINTCLDQADMFLLHMKRGRFRWKVCMPEKKTIIENKGKKIVSSGLVRRGFLVGVSANILGQGYVLESGETLIGRDSSCRIRINDKQISGIHCRINSSSQGIIIEDLDSSNGTYLNRKKIKKPMPINYGDRIVIGESILRFLFEEEL